MWCDGANYQRNLPIWIDNEAKRNCEWIQPQYAPLATIQPGMAMELNVMGANDFYINLNNSRLHFLAMITNADGTNIDPNTAAPINLTQHSMFREIGLQLNGRNVGDTSQLFPYRSVLESLLNFCKKVQETRLLSKGWTKGTSGHMNVTAVSGNKAGLNARAATFVRSTLVEIIGRPHLDVFHQERLITPNIDLHMKLIPSPNEFVCKSAAPGQGAQQKNYKLVIKSANLIIRTNKLTSTAHKGLMDLLVLQNMMHHLSRVQMKHLSIPSNQASINFDNVFTGALPDLVVVGLVSDADLAGGYQRNPFNFQNFCVNCIELKRNNTSRPSEVYTPNVATGQYIEAYLTFLQELECDTGNKSVSLTSSEWLTDTRYTRPKSLTVVLDQERTIYDSSLQLDRRAWRCHLTLR